MLCKIWGRLFKRQEIIMEKTEAEKKYEKYKSLDPYPDIHPALLNSADIESYVHATGMVDPFNNNDLKSASYEAKICGICWYWDEEGIKQKELIDAPNKTFTLKQNSIAFVEVEPKFRLPDYIALRFNLKITHVYRGLLLGTGPLIDPGYVGKIYIPLHNLTSNSYTFEYGEGLIWIEFTKVSESTLWVREQTDVVEKIGKYKHFNKEKINKSLDYFIHKANKGGAIRSSIPTAVEEAKTMAKNAESSAKWIRNFSFVALLALVVSIATLLYNSWLLQRNYVDGMSELTSELKIQIYDQKALFKRVEEDLVSANIQITELKTQIDSISKDKKVNSKHK